MEGNNNFGNGFDFGGGEASTGVDAGAGLTFDLTGVDENASNSFEVLPKGQYSAIVDELEFGESKAGAPMITVKFIIDGGEYDGRVIFDYYVLGGQNEKAIEFGLSKLKKFLVRVCPGTDMTAFRPDVFANSGEAVGKRCVLDLNIQTQKKGDYKGEKRNTIKDILAPETSSFM